MVSNAPKHGKQYPEKLCCDIECLFYVATRHSETSNLQMPVPVSSWDASSCEYVAYHKKQNMLLLQIQDLEPVFKSL